MRRFSSRPACFLALGAAAAASACATVAAGAEEPRVVAVWPSGPLEVRVAFDRPLAKVLEEALVGKTIRLDPSAGSLAGPNTACPPASVSETGPAIAAVRRQDDGTLLVLATDPHSRPGVYCLRLPTPGASVTTLPSSGQDVAYDLSGVEASWDDGSNDAKPAWTGWWPSLDPDVTRKLTRGSREHERALAFLEKPGRLTLRTLVTLRQGAVKVRIQSSQPLVEAALGAENAALDGDGANPMAAEFSLDAPGDPLFLTIVARTGQGGKPVTLTATLQEQSSASKPIGRELLSVPWSPPAPPVPAAPPAPPDFTGGDPKRGEALFFGDTAKCAGCHQISGKGQKVGPDLTNVFQRPAAEVYRDIAEPSAVIRFEYVPYTLAVKDGRVLAGIVRADGADAVRLTDTEAKTTVIPRTEIEELRPTATSVMPVGLVGAIGEARMRDLMAFLMKRKP